MKWDAGRYGNEEGDGDREGEKTKGVGVGSRDSGAIQLSKGSCMQVVQRKRRIYASNRNLKKTDPL